MQHGRPIKKFTLFVNHVSWVLFHPLFKILYKLKVELPDELKKTKKPFIVISNHKSPSDPWVLEFTLPFSTYRQVTPLAALAAQHFRIPVLKRLYKLGVIPLIYWLYDVVILPRRKQLDGTIATLNSGRSVLVFPEGGINRQKGIKKFQRGASYLQKHTGAPILPVAIRRTGKGPRRGCTVRWGKPLHASQAFFIEEKEAAHWLREEVLRLYHGDH